MFFSCWSDFCRSTLLAISGAADAVFFDQFRDLLSRAEHTDVEFIVGKERESVPAHKAILVARSDYCHALFRRGGMSTEWVEVPQYPAGTSKRMRGAGVSVHESGQGVGVLLNDGSARSAHPGERVPADRLEAFVRVRRVDDAE